MKTSFIRALAGGLSAAEFSHRTGVPPATAYRWFAGTAVPSIDAAMDAARRLGYFQSDERADQLWDLMEAMYRRGVAASPR